jgi:hypothetical protein
VEEFGFPLLIFVALVIFNVIRGAARMGDQTRRTPGAPRPDSLPGANTDFLEVLRALELERARTVPYGRPKRLPGATPAEPVEPELDEEAKLVEVDAGRLARNEESRDAASLEAARRRRLAVEQRERPRTAADHAAFDARIRAEADHTAAEPPGDRGARLRDAMIWNELLGRPVSLRDDADLTPR